MIKKLILILTIMSLTVASYAIELKWDYPWDTNCLKTRKFRLYQSDIDGQPKKLIKEISCVENTVHLDNNDFIKGYYTVTAEHIDLGESDHSNSVLLAYYYNLTLYDYDSNGKIIYKGEHTGATASEANIDWTITRYWWVGHKKIRQQTKTGSWSDRASGWD